MRILIAEDDLTSRRILSVVLKKSGYDVVETADGEEAWKVMQQPDAPGLAVLDWMMPGMDGLEVVRRVRAIQSTRPPYLIMLTAKGEKADVVAGLDAGADDYLAKPFDLRELQARVGVGARIFRLQRVLARAARTDSLTELPNRAGILRSLEYEFSRSKREGYVVGIALLDIDHFKGVNDTFGHPAGDDVLREFGHRCRMSLRAHDSVGRYGGEEFLVVAPHCKAGEAPWERLRAAVASSPFKTRAGEVSVTASIGVAYGIGDLPPEKLIAEADQALYRAKESGRNRVRVSSFRGFPASPASGAPGGGGEDRASQALSEPPALGPSAQPAKGDGERRILVAEDDPVSRTLLVGLLKKSGYEVVQACDGSQALKELQKPDAPGLAVLDWMMPEMDGLEVVRQVRAMSPFPSSERPRSPADSRDLRTEGPFRRPYLIILTAKREKEDIVAGLDAGADDYLAKPFHAGELRARIRTGLRMLEMQDRMTSAIGELGSALEKIKTLRGIVPICSSCKKVRDDAGYWRQVEAYIRDHTDAEFRHSLCPDCLEGLYPDLGDGEEGE